MDRSENYPDPRRIVAGLMPADPLEFWMTDPPPLPSRRARIAARARFWALRIAVVVVPLALIAGVSVPAVRVAYERGVTDGRIDPVRVVGDEALGLGQSVLELAGPSVVTVAQSGGGLGSGFFIEAGTVVTNLHVIAGTEESFAQLAVGDLDGIEVEVILADGRTRPGRVVGIDARLDVAVLEVRDVDDVEPLRFAPRDEAQAGEPVVVLGSPFGMANSVSTGVLSSSRRNSQFRANGTQSNLLQTDAAINPGNSGGPLLDAAGRVLGMVTLRPDEADGRAAQGIGFALPAEAVLRSVGLILDGEVPSYALLGVTGRSATSDDPVEPGAVVVALAEEALADDAGIEVDDVIVAIDGVPIPDFETLVGEVMSRSPGDVVELTVVRAKGDPAKPDVVEVELIERPDGA